ncbi:hypothetical protein ACFQ0B_75400 [Nonomuraea thailandensis]
MHAGVVLEGGVDEPEVEAGVGQGERRPGVSRSQGPVRVTLTSGSEPARRASTVARTSS